MFDNDGVMNEAFAYVRDRFHTRVSTEFSSRAIDANDVSRVGLFLINFFSPR